MTTYEGRCHCGAVEWTAKLPEESHVLCHCGACKLMSGGEYTLNQIIDKSDLKITKGEPKKYVYKGDSGNNTDCFYCGNCTANVYHHQHVMGPDKIVIRTGLLKGSDKWGQPVAEIFTKDKLSWQPQVGKAMFEAAPPS